MSHIQQPRLLYLDSAKIDLPYVHKDIKQSKNKQCKQRPRQTIKNGFCKT